VKSKDSYKAVQEIRLQWMCWLLIGGLALGLAAKGCLSRSSRGACVGKSVYGRRQRKAGMGSYLCMGPFILALNSFYSLTSRVLQSALRWYSCSLLDVNLQTQGSIEGLSASAFFVMLRNCKLFTNRELDRKLEGMSGKWKFRNSPIIPVSWIGLDHISMSLNNKHHGLGFFM
jgi:hypothetical protein